MKKILLLITLSLLIIGSLVFFYVSPFTSTPITSTPDNFNVIIIGWDGLQRDHFFDCYNKKLNECSGGLKNIQQLSGGKIFNLTVTNGETMTKPGWAQILSGYNAEITGIYSNTKYAPLPKGYSVFEKAENYFGDNKIHTVFLGSKPNHLGATCKGEQNEIVNYQGKKEVTAESLGEPWCITKNYVDSFETGIGHNKDVGKKALKVLDEYKSKYSQDQRLLAFFHFGEPDETGHQKGEDSSQYSKAIIDDDEWLGKIMNKLREIGIDKNTYIYVLTDHGFDEDGFTNGHNHFNAPFGIFASNDSSIKRNGDRRDLTPTLLKKYGLDLNKQDGNPALNGYPLDSFPASSCVKEGDAYINYTSAAQCCSGLKLINLDQKVVVKNKDQNGCHSATGGTGDSSGYCTQCGNNVCDSPENECNCPEDCDSSKKIKTDTTANTTATLSSELSSEFISHLTDEKATAAKIGGTDIGLGVARGTDKIWFLFGDTSFKNEHAGASAVAVSSYPYCDKDECPDIEWKMFGNKFFEPLTSSKIVGSDMSTVPAGAVEINNKLYIFATRMTEWEFQNLKDCKEQNGVMSGAKCQSKKQYNAAEGYNGTGETHAYGLLFKETATGSFAETGVKWDLDGLHLRTAPVKGKLANGDPVIYMAITGNITVGKVAYRSTPLYLAYVEPDKIEDKTSYNYLVGLDQNNQPKWSKNIKEAKPLMGTENTKVGEPSFVYNSVLDKYLIMFKDYSGSKKEFLLYSANNPYGPYTSYGVQGCGESNSRPSWWENKWQTPWSGCYGGYIIPNLFGNDGKEIYFTVSLWNPYKVIVLKTKLP